MTNPEPPDRLLLAYVHLRPGVPDATRHLLHDYVRSYAEREGFHLGEILTGVELVDDRQVLGTLVDLVRSRGPEAVLITGPARHALATVRAIRGVRVLTLADVSPVW
jgi:hypothetical protein